MNSYGAHRVEIADGATTGSSVQTGSFTCLAIEFPASFTGLTITFEAARSQDGTYLPIVDSSGSAISITATDSSVVALTEDQQGQLTTPMWIRPVSASAESGLKVLYFHMK